MTDSKAPDQSFVAYSVSLPQSLAEYIDTVAGEVGEPIAVLMRQVCRVAIANNWEAAALEQLSEGTVRREARAIRRLAVTDTMKADIDRLCDGVALSRWFKHALIRFQSDASRGQRAVWSLRP